MKKLLATTALAALLAIGISPVRANENMSVDDKLDKMDDKLELTDTQEAQIRPILQQKKDGKISKESAHQQIRVVLNDQQKVAYDEMKAEKKSEKKDKAY